MHYTKQLTRCQPELGKNTKIRSGTNTDFPLIFFAIGVTLKKTF